MSLTNRYDFVLLFDVKDGNPNGDPDAGNLPRMDAETGHGLITDVSLKRKVRNFVGIAKGEQPPFEIYVKEKAVLNSQHRRAYLAYELTPESKKLPKSVEDAKKLTGWMCKNFFDVRTFGAVMTTEVNCGQVRGPVQLTFARSIDPIIAQEHSITVCAARKEDKPIEEQIGIQGRKHTVPYGLYMAHGFVSSFLAKQTGFSEDDLELLWQALAQMFEHDRSAARGEMTTRGLYVFKHDSELGNAPAHALFERIQVQRKAGVEVPRCFQDYDVSVSAQDLPVGVTLMQPC
ncbi:MAG: type I-C CRISPR-associated protein Cas7/Csd2 [Porticoccaceae bacterium]